MRVGLAIVWGAGLLLGAGFAHGGAGSPAGANPEGIAFFESKVRPVLAERCYSCHSAGAKKLKGGLHLDSIYGMRKGGESGTPALSPGDLDDSLMIAAIRYELNELKMPPKEKLPAEQIAAIEAWVKMGAPHPKETTVAATQVAATKPALGMSIEDGKKFWSFVPPVEPAVPTGPAKNEIDRFVGAKLSEENLAPSPEADRATLLRRATYDLTGLPPTTQQAKEFAEDSSPIAYEKVVDRLLASSQYGERWGRYWLDVARYADTKGYVFEEERRYAFSHTYRDWVIGALNSDLPYDQFLIQQIAADRLDLKDDKKPLAAMGFLTLGRRFLNNQHDIIDDRIDVLTRGTMGIAVSCSRCHDHKFDPIPTADYYSLYGIFASSREPADLPIIETAKGPEAEDYEKQRVKLTADIEAFREKRKTEIAASYRTAASIAAYMLAAQKLGDGDETATQAQAKAANLEAWMLTRWRDFLKAEAAKDQSIFSLWNARTSKATTKPALENVNRILAEAILQASPKDEKELAAVYGAVLGEQPEVVVTSSRDDEELRQVLDAENSPTKLSPDRIVQQFTIADNAQVRALTVKVEELAIAHPGAPTRAMAMEDSKDPVEPVIFVRGNPQNKGKAVPRQFLAVLSPDDRKPFAQGSGRLELARAIASKDNPLTARVMVNRVWQYHFGQGLVRTPSDFGTRGDRPTHPELLDWLALRFVNEDGWSLKKLHKRIMLSSAYRQSSAFRSDADAIDPENHLLWRQNRRRLDFEALRDSLLAASGHLDLKLGGKSINILAQPFSPRRSIYAFIDRQNLPGMFRTFDFASPDATSSRRFDTSVPQQALFMMNSPFVLEQSRKVAAATTQPIAEPENAQRVKRLYAAVLRRDPSDEEMKLGLAFVTAELNQPPAATQPANSIAWKYGYGEFDDSAQKLKAFEPLPHFVADVWQGGPALPDPKLGWVMLSAGGGHVGNNLKHAAVRRFVADRDCSVTISGELTHKPREGDGVRARIVTTQDGVLATYMVHRKSAQTQLTDVSLKRGETIDFIVDCGAKGDFGYDEFGWAITITKTAPPTAVAGDDSGATWKSVEDFAGPMPKRMQPLSAWEKYAQVLLESNEFAFVN